MAGYKAQPAVILDYRGYRCPIPVIRLESALRDMQEGEQVTVFADDPVAGVDIPHFCAAAGHKAEKVSAPAGACAFAVTIGPESA